MVNRLENGNSPRGEIIGHKMPRRTTRWRQVMPRVRIELTTLGLWDLRAACCATEAHVLSSTFISIRKILWLIQIATTGCSNFRLATTTSEELGIPLGAFTLLTCSESACLGKNTSIPDFRSVYTTLDVGWNVAFRWRYNLIRTCWAEALNKQSTQSIRISMWAIVRRPFYMLLKSIKIF